jgi:hypothetical protein
VGDPGPAAWLSTLWSLLMANLRKELKHPIRAALITWAATSLFVAACWPFLDIPILYLPLGIGFCAFISWMVIGMWLLSNKGSNLLYFTTVILPGVIGLLIGLYVHLTVTSESSGISLETLGVLLFIAQVFLGLPYLGISLFALWGWVRFFRKGHSADTPNCGA